MIYIHIPFCRKACSYCDFHFSVNHNKINELVDAIVLEIELRKDYLESKNLNTIYFGGGTPSLLDNHHLKKIFSTINKYFKIDSDTEITLEANPDDLTIEKLGALKQTPINRLSIGVQSFIEDDLKLMNRAHNAEMAVASVMNAAKVGFNNITVDLIYGIPGMDNEKWKQNLLKAFSLPVQHLSCYNLTVEKKTALHKMIREGIVADVNDEDSSNHFRMLMDLAEQNGFDHYEISNFAKGGCYSRHNSSYWKNKHYLGIGPSAHSYNGISRQWNISSNSAYISTISKHEVPCEMEVLTVENKYNEYILTSLRTKWGVSADYILQHFGEKFLNDFLAQTQDHISSGDILVENKSYILSKKGQLLADRIAAKAFLI